MCDLTGPCTCISPAPLPDKEPAIVRRGGEAMRGWVLVDDRNSATRLAFRPFDSWGVIILDTTVWTVERLPRKELTPVEMAAFLGAAFPDFSDPHARQAREEARQPKISADTLRRVTANIDAATELRARVWRTADMDRSRLGLIIWNTSRTDEGSISATGATIVADAILRDWEPAVTIAEQAATIERVRAVCADHWDYQTRREAKFGREGSGCVCEICNVMRVLGPQPKGATS